MCYLQRKPGKECNREARALYVQEPDLNPKTRSAVCLGMKAVSDACALFCEFLTHHLLPFTHSVTQYNMILKQVVLDLKGNIRPEAVTAEGMEALFEEKVVSGVI